MAGPGQLLACDGIGLAQDVEALPGDLTDDPDAQAGTGERLSPHDLRWQTELLADQPDLVLEEGAQRLDELELEVVGKAADVVVGLDVGGARSPTRLDDVGVERALAEEGGLGGLEGADELVADDLALLLGVANPGERLEELLLGIDHDQLGAGR